VVVRGSGGVLVDAPPLAALELQHEGLDVVEMRREALMRRFGNANELRIVGRLHKPPSPPLFFFLQSALAHKYTWLTCSPLGVRYALAPTMAPKLSSSPAMSAQSKSWCFWGDSSRTDAPSAKAPSKRDGSSGEPASCTVRRVFAKENRRAHKNTGARLVSNKKIFW
jgi:hypothetical protein